VVRELARHAAEHQAPQPRGAARDDDDQIRVLFSRDVDDRVRRLALARVLLDREARLREPALVAREHAVGDPRRWVGSWRAVMPIRSSVITASSIAKCDPMQAR
jgi:hypothetical protein